MCGKQAGSAGSCVIQCSDDKIDFEQLLSRSARPAPRRDPIAGDKGLCALTNVFRTAPSIRASTSIAARKAVTRGPHGRLAAELHTAIPHLPEARAMPASPGTFQPPRVDEVRIVATRFVNTLSQEAVSLEYLPVGEIGSLKVPGVDLAGIAADDGAEAVFEPNADALLGYLLGHYLNFYVYYVLLNAKASEQSARMVSMKNATESAESLIKALKLEYNTLRQGNITRELLEIAGGEQ